MTTTPGSKQRKEPNLQTLNKFCLSRFVLGYKFLKSHVGRTYIIITLAILSGDSFIHPYSFGHVLNLHTSSYLSYYSSYPRHPSYLILPSFLDLCI